MKTKIRVLSNPGRWRDGDNPFLKLLFESLEPHVDVEHFSWRRAILGRYDVLHVHWLEYLIRAPSRSRVLGKRALFLALLLRLRLTKTPSVWTVHNETPHERANRVESAYLNMWASSVTRKVVLNSGSTWAGRSDTTLIPHGHYRPILNGPREARSVVSDAVQLLFFGYLRKYKGLEHLIEVVGAGEARHDGRPLRLRVVGSPNELSYGDELVRLAAVSPNVAVQLGFLSDAKIEEEIYDADCVVLPYLRMQNSGAALLSLSCARPIIVPNSPSMRELQEEVGQDWVRIFEPPLSAEQLTHLCEALPVSGAPDLSRRDWASIADAYVRVYREITARGRA